MEPKSELFSEWNELCPEGKKYTAAFLLTNWSVTTSGMMRFLPRVWNKINRPNVKSQKEEKALLNHLKKYKENHLLFLYDFQIHYNNNMSEKYLRIC